MPPEIKKCSCCAEIKSISDFYRNKKGFTTDCRDCRSHNRKLEYAALPAESKEHIKAKSRKWYYTNRERYAARARQYRKENPGCHLNSVRKRLYGIDSAQFETIKIAQDNKCAICKRIFDETRKGQANVDHDHETGKVRGLLCHSCNIALGHLDDSVGRLQDAIRYLQGYERLTHK